MVEFSDYIIYADESGDHNLRMINPRYPIFCLALCIVRKDEYINNIPPAIQQLKFDYWGHDKIVLHEREIRKQEGDFSCFATDKVKREAFLKRHSDLMKDSKFWVVSSVIDKEKLKKQYNTTFDPYHKALEMCMERALSILLDEKQDDKKITFIFENRGKKEDAQLVKI